MVMLASKTKPSVYVFAIRVFVIYS